MIGISIFIVARDEYIDHDGLLTRCLAAVQFLPQVLLRPMAMPVGGLRQLWYA